MNLKLCKMFGLMEKSPEWTDLDLESFLLIKYKSGLNVDKTMPGLRLVF